MLLDTHAHLNLSPLYEHWLEVLDQAETAGVGSVIVPGASIETSRIAVELSHRDNRIYAAVGIHPEAAESIGELKKLANDARVVAIGECGLDYFRSIETREQQKKLFKLQVDLANEMDLPLIVHTRTVDAMNDAVEIIKTKTRMVFHCFSGDWNFWRKIEPLGAFVGVGATITYPKNDELRKTIGMIPLDRIVLETDAPWLPPQSKRGQINTPANVTIAACKLAEIKQVQLTEVLEDTGNNALRLFQKLNYESTTSHQ
jgi:TatD DNase family protein